MKSFKLRLNPWLGQVGMGSPTQERESWLNTWAMYYHKTCADRPDLEQVPVYSFDNAGKLSQIDSRLIAGAHTFTVKRGGKLRIIRLNAKRPIRQSALEAMILQVDARIKKIDSSIKLTTISDGWCAATGNSCTLDLLYSTEGYGPQAVNEDFARAKLWFRLDDKSSVWGIHKTAVVPMDRFRCLADGAAIMRRSDLKVPVHVAHWQWTGYRNLENFVFERKMVVKGMVFLASDEEYNEYLEHYSLDKSVEVIVSDDTVKFYDDVQVGDIEYFAMMPSIMKHRAALSFQTAARMHLTEVGRKLIFSTWRTALGMNRSAFEDLSGSIGLGLMDRFYTEMVEDDDEMIGDLVAHAEENGAIQKTLAFLPYGPDWYFNKIGSKIFEKYLKKIYVTGITTKAMPDWRLAENEIIVPASSGIEIGTGITGLRSPNTGREAFEASVIDTTPYNVVFVNPEVWARVCAGDFDGDTIAIIPITGIFEYQEEIESLKTKEKVRKPLYKYIAMMYYIKLQAVSDADRFTTQTIEQGGDKRLAAELQQAVIDGLKNRDSIPNIQGLANEKYPAFGLDLPSIYQVIRGRFGDNERGRIFRYNELVDDAVIAMSNVPWLRELCKELFYVIVPSKALKFDRTYVSHCAYKKIAERADLGHLVTPEKVRKCQTSAPRFSDEGVTLATPALKKAFARINSGSNAAEVKELAIRLHNGYIKFYKMLGMREIDQAFDHLRKMVAYVVANPEISGSAIKYLWIAITLREKVSHNIPQLVWNYNMFAYFPAEIGEFNLAKASALLGKRPALEMHVVKAYTK